MNRKLPTAIWLVLSYVPIPLYIFLIIKSSYVKWSLICGDHKGDSGFCGGQYNPTGFYLSITLGVSLALISLTAIAVLIKKIITAQNYTKLKKGIFLFLILSFFSFICFVAIGIINLDIFWLRD